MVSHIFLWSRQINIIIGGLGFIGINLVRTLLRKNEKVLVIDDFSNSAVGKDLFTHQNFEFVAGDINNSATRDSILKKLKMEQEVYLWHLAANSDIRASSSNPYIDLERTLNTTLSSIKLAGEIRHVNFLFSSSSAIYGNYPNQRLNETKTFPNPVSPYGISKLASEFFLKSSIGVELKTLLIFRFPNVIGSPLTHGFLFDWLKQLQQSRNKLNVLGDGNQKKQYLHVDTLISMMQFVIQSGYKNHVINLAPDDDGVTIKQILKMFQKVNNLDLEITFQKTSEGWRGDVPVYSLETDTLKRAGWRESHTSMREIEKGLHQNLL
jgi:UDP-glucose 4-epimerase